MKKVSSKLDKDFYSILQNLANDCADASNIPQWVEHFFSSDRYEMSGEEGGRLKDLLEDSVTKCQYLSDIYNKETDAIANVQQAYSDLIDLKMSWQKIDDCLKEFKKVSKPFL